MVIRDRALLKFVSTWIVCVILLAFSSFQGFSFERGNVNTVAGAMSSAAPGAAEQETPTVLRIQRAGAYLLGAMLIFPLIKRIGAEASQNTLIVALVLWAMLSCVWSQNPRGSLEGAIQLALDIAFVFFLLNRYTPNEILKLLVLVGSVAAVGSLFLIALFPDVGLQKRDLLAGFGAWQGIFNQKNACGAVMTFLLLPGLFVHAEGRRQRVFRIVYVLVVLVIVVMAQSAGNWLVCGSCLGFALTIRVLVKLKPRDAWAFCIVLFGTVVAAVICGVTFADSLLRLLGKDPTMTGRTGLWASVMASILKRPLMGYGYRAFWQGLVGESANVILHAHWQGVLGYAENGLLELWLDLGAIGVLFYLVVYFSGVKNAVYCFRREPSPIVLWYCTVLFYVAVSNIGDGILLFPSSLVSLVPFLVYAGLGREARRIRDLQIQ